MRIFAAIPVLDEAADQLDRFAETMTVGRILPEDQWHITLAFAQDVAEVEAEEFALNVTEISADRFAWSISGFGVFGADRPRQIHAVIALDPALLSLHAKVRRAARNAGLVLPHSRFVPHITLSRLTGAPLDLHGAQWLAMHTSRALGPFIADQIVVYESELHHGGPRYSEIATCRLG